MGLQKQSLAQQGQPSKACALAPLCSFVHVGSPTDGTIAVVHHPR